MKKNALIAVFTIIYFFVSKTSHANATLRDSSTFESQRAKVNNLLDERVQKFGDYDLSLTKKTGFFGLMKSKQDLQNSNNILQEIVKMDNKIFMETRTLLRIKDYEAERFQQLATEYDNQVTAYMRTVSKLQASNENLNEEIESLKNAESKTSVSIIFFSIVIISLLIVLQKQKNQMKVQKLTKL